jgi:hypothetical protein
MASEERRTAFELLESSRDWYDPRLMSTAWLGFVSYLVASTAHAAPEGETAKIAVAPFEIEGELSSEAVAKLEGQLVAGLERGGAAIVPPSRAATGSATLPCGEGAGCIVALAEANEATHVLQVKITQSGRDYSLEMMLSSGTDGSIQAKSTQTCEICGLQELGELIGDQAAAFQPKLEAVPATLIVETTPPGAMVKVDGRVVGVSPIVEPVEPGEHTITIVKEGYHERERKVTFVAGGEETVTLGLQPIPVPVAEPEAPDGRGMRIAGWSSLGVGLGVLTGGITLLVIDERPVQSRCGDPMNIDVNGLCLYRYDTLAGGIGLAIGGGAAVIAGAVLVGLGYKRKQAKRKAGGGGKQALVLPTGTGIAVHF